MRTDLLNPEDMISEARANFGGSDVKGINDNQQRFPSKSTEVMTSEDLAKVFATSEEAAKRKIDRCQHGTPKSYTFRGSHSKPSVCNISRTTVGNLNVSHAFNVLQTPWQKGSEDLYKRSYTPRTKKNEMVKDRN